MSRTSLAEPRQSDQAEQTVQAYPSKAAFQASVNSAYRVTAQDSTVVELELIELRDGPPSERFEQFALTFLAPGNVAPQQALLRLEHDELGTMDVLLVPVGRDEKGIYFEAVFSRRIDRQD